MANLAESRVDRDGRGTQERGAEDAGRSKTTLAANHKHARKIASAILERYGSFLGPEDVKECVQMAARTSYEYAKFARFHEHTDTLVREGGGIAVFGSARPKATDTNPIRKDAFAMAEEAGRLITNTRLPISRSGKLSEDCLAVVSGAGPGLMEASCIHAQNKVWGHGILVPHEDGFNPFIPTDRAAMYLRFPMRKLALMDDKTRGVMVLPGGYGTVEEFTEVLNLTESGVLPRKPVVFVGTDFWNPIFSHIAEHGVVSPETKKSIVIVAGPDQALAYIQGWYQRNPDMMEYQPFRLTENFSGGSPVGCFCDGAPTSSGVNALADYILEEFETLLSGKKVDQHGKTIDKTNIWHLCDERVMYGVFKFFFDRLDMECGLAKAGVKSFVLQMGSPDHEGFAANQAELLRRGHSVAFRMPEAMRIACSQRAGVPVLSGLVVRRPEGARDVLLPSRYRLTPIDVATEPGRIRGIAAAEGQIATYHRIFESLTWMQTGKLPKDVKAAALESSGGTLPGFFKAANNRLLAGEFIKAQDVDNMRFRRNAREVVDALELS